MSQGALPGFRDFYPAELSERSYIMNTWREVVRRYAFVEYDGPPLEPLELYTKKSGDEIIGQLYNFVDKGGRDVALRPEMTPTLARMVAAKASALRKPVRWFAIPQLFRYERQQRGRLREHYQLNVDIIGETDVTADAELLACAIDVMKAFGLTEHDVVARVSDRRILHAYITALGVKSEAVPMVFSVIDKLERQPVEVSLEKLAAAGVPNDASLRISEIASATIDTVAETIGEDAIADFRRYLNYANALVPGGSEWVKFDLGIVRGLAYYTGIVFELFDRKGELRAICGGGRYDNLLESLGGVDLPALGFGMGDVVLAELLRERGLMRSASHPADVWVAADEDVATEKVMSEAARLRGEGKSVEYSLRRQSLSKQNKAAKTLGVKEIITVTN